MAVRAINFISLCTGGGGLDLGIDLAMPEARPVVLVEREAFACAHLVAAMQQGLMADAPLWSDVTTFNGRPWRGLVDGLIGGIPCQPHSLAGRRLGADDERDLWSDARRIIVQSGAWFVLIENVGGILTSGGAERLFRDFSRLGFASEVGLFAAAEVGASHRRERLFWLAVADRASARRPISGPESCGRPKAAWRLQSGRLGGEVRGAMADADLARSPQPGSQRSDPRPQCAAPERVRWDVEHAIGCGHNRRQDGAIGRKIDRTAVEGPSGDVDLFPPGPADLDRWRAILARAPQLEPAIRKLANGLAARVDNTRVDELRLLGNGCVPLQVAYAFRTLAARLAARGSAGADELVRMMEIEA